MAQPPSDGAGFVSVTHLVVSWVLFGLVLVAWATAIAGAHDDLGYVDILWTGYLVAFAAIGLLLSIKVPRNAVGWFFLLAGLLVLGGVALEGIAGDSWSAVTVLGFWALLSGVIFFPTGTLPHRWWWGIYAAWSVVFWIADLVLGDEGSFVFAAGFLLMVGSLIYRAVTGNPSVRRQLRVPLLPLGFAFVFMFLGDFVLDSEALLNIGWAIFGIGLPLSIAVAVLRYRLYDIDRLFKRTVTYAAVVAVLVAVYGASITLFQALVPVEGDLATAASTLIAVAAFNPVRVRAQRSVDRLLFRTRYDPRAVAAHLQDQIRRAEADQDSILNAWTNAVDASLKPTAVGVWIRRASTDP